MKHRTNGRRRLDIFLLTAVLALGLVTPAWAVSVSDFTDVSSGSWYYGAVSYVVDRGLFNGVSATEFRPGGTMTRGMFLTVLGRFAGVDPDAWRAGTVNASGVNMRSGPSTDSSVLATLDRGAAVTITGKTNGWYKVLRNDVTGYISAEYVTPSYHRFEDVDYGAYYAGYVIWGYEKGIVNGTSDTRFSPNSNVTREQICKLLHGYAKAAGKTLAQNTEAVTFADQSSISSWAAEGVAALQRAGVIQGEQKDGVWTFRPGSNAKRSEAAAIFQRFASALSDSPQSETGTGSEFSGNEENTGQEQSGGTGPDSSGSEELTGGDVAGDYEYGTIYGPYLNETKRMEIKEAVRAFLAAHYDPNASDYDNVKAAHDFLVDTVVYEYNNDTNEAWTAWGALVHHGATCHGYARAFKALCDAMDIGCYFVPSNRTQHAWNIVQVDGQWYHIDVDGNDESGFNYVFLESDSYMQKEGYSWDSSYPACPQTYGK